MGRGAPGNGHRRWSGRSSGREISWSRNDLRHGTLLAVAGRPRLASQENAVSPAPILPCRRRRRRLTAVVLSACLAGIAVTAGARLVVPEQAGSPATEPVLDRLERAILTADHRSLADLMHEDGVRLELSPVAERSSHLTPEQAFYYFRNLLASRRTLRFEFRKSQSSGDTRMHAMAIWRWERADGGRVESRRLLFTLARGADGWRVTEITTLRGD
jgi:hypothetical protein